MIDLILDTIRVPICFTIGIFLVEKIKGGAERWRNRLMETGYTEK